jgi:hypothetical protein
MAAASFIVYCLSYSAFQKSAKVDVELVINVTTGTEQNEY